MIVFNNVYHKEIDYQELYFFNCDIWQKIIAKGEVNKVKLNTVQLERLKKWSLPLSNKYSDLVLAGSIETTGEKKRFNIYSLINFSGYYQRVELRSIVCSNCKKRIVIGNPYVSDIYFGVPSDKDIQKVMNKASRFEHLAKCPICDSVTITQSAVWAKPALI
jgi:hypothetical protein